MQIQMISLITRQYSYVKVSQLKKEVTDVKLQLGKISHGSSSSGQEAVFCLQLYERFPP